MYVSLSSGNDNVMNETGNNEEKAGFSSITYSECAFSRWEDGSEWEIVGVGYGVKV